jgi:hypothetical protein
MEDEIEIKEAESGGVNPDDPSTWPDIDGPAEAVVGSERSSSPHSGITRSTQSGMTQR